MRKSLCIKTNNETIKNYLLENFQNLNIDNIYLSDYNFRIYNNIIIHYSGNNVRYFLEQLSEILSTSVIKFYEMKIIKNILFSNYFYFTDIEHKKILDLCEEHLQSNSSADNELKKDIVSLSFQDYFTDNKSVILDGFVKFRINNYLKTLDSIVDLCVNNFVIEREYSEFIDLLKVYINSKESASNVVHLIYNNQESTLLDEFKNIIELDTIPLVNTYLSDISFSSNDFALNSLLTLLPKTIHIHIIDAEDEFINTLKLIFGNRVFICSDCNLCKMYRLEKVQK